MELIQDILIKRDGITRKEADKIVEIAKEDLNDRLLTEEDDLAFSICQDHFGLEADFIDQLI